MNIQGGDISAELMDVVHAIAMRTIATETLEETAKPEYMSEVEFAIVDRLLSDALSAGYLISVYSGKEVVVRRSRDRKRVLAAMASTDADKLTFWYKAEVELKDYVGWVYLTYGNDCDVISDYIDNRAMELLTAGALALADEYAGRQ